MRRRVACAQTTKYGGKIPEWIVHELDKGSADRAGLDEGPGDGTDNGAGFAGGHAELEECGSDVETLQAKFNEGAAGR